MQSKLWPFIFLLFISVIQSFIFLPFFDLPEISGDYAQFIPQMINGLAFIKQNGILSVPWFSPGKCAGVPFLADPNNLYFSLPQLLTLIFNPILSIKITFFIFSFVGGIGFYRLLEKGLNLSIESSLLGASLFLLCSFFPVRMMAGHLSFHAYPLLPWILIPFVYKSEGVDKESMFNMILSGLLISYTFYSGAFHLLIPLSLVALIFISIKKIQYSEYKIPLFQVSFVMALSVMASLTKLLPALNFFSHFQRDFYHLPGWTSFIQLMLIIFVSLFGHPNLEMINKSLSYIKFKIPIAELELEYSIGVIPLVLIFIFIIKKFKTLMNFCKRSGRSQRLAIISLLILLSIPIAVNFYTPVWNNFLKRIPMIKSSSTLGRWFSIYIPFIILLSVFALEKMKYSQKVMRIILFSGVIVTLVQLLVWDKSYFENQGYRPVYVQKAWEKIKESDTAPVITNIIKDSHLGNMSFIEGDSSIHCMMAIFGYHLERFPGHDLKVGDIYQSDGKFYNFKNPACYIFPEENNCQVGDRFRVEQRSELEALARFENYSFKTPLTQKIANWISLITVLLGIFYLISFLVYRSVLSQKKE